MRFQKENAPNNDIAETSKTSTRVFAETKPYQSQRKTPKRKLGILSVEPLVGKTVFHGNLEKKKKPRKNLLEREDERVPSSLLHGSMEMVLEEKLALGFNNEERGVREWADLHAMNRYFRSENRFRDVDFVCIFRKDGEVKRFPE